MNGRCYGAEPATSVITTESSDKVRKAMAPPPSVLKSRVRAAPFCMATTGVGKLRSKNQASLATCLGTVYEINDFYLFKQLKKKFVTQGNDMKFKFQCP